ncbi:MAG: hypothetical protein IJS71_06275 [Clostridia bacterium]|nr:hypothetical protein [Clostridia bacterium]
MKKEDEELKDDGRVIADMNVDGMPWYVPNKPNAEGEAEDLKKLSKKETLFLILGVAGAALLVAAIFGLGYFFFILFADKVWFHN